VGIGLASPHFLNHMQYPLNVNISKRTARIFMKWCRGFDLSKEEKSSLNKFWHKLEAKIVWIAIEKPNEEIEN